MVVIKIILSYSIMISSAYCMAEDWTVYNCHSCNSAKDLNCISNPYQGINKDYCISIDKKCYTKVIKGILYRGCVSITENVCENEKYCEICDDGNWCNNRTIHDTCIQCNDSQCRSDFDASSLTVVCSMKSITESEGCYFKKSGERGCMEDLSNEDREQCNSQSDDCQSCTSSNCNQKVDFKCFECNGETSARCARNEYSTQVSCDSKTCVAGIDANGRTHRGCAPFDKYTSNSLQFPDGFQRCFEDSCNNKNFPDNRTLCYQCDLINCTNVIGHDETLLKPCYSVRDKCYSYLSKDGYSYYRGCMTDDNRGKMLCDSTPGDCKVCIGNACNSHQHWPISSSHCSQSHYICTVISIFITCLIKF